MSTAIDLGSVTGFVTSSGGLPISGASVYVYKHMELIDSAEKNPGYSTSVITESDVSYSFSDLPPIIHLEYVRQVRRTLS